MKEYHKIQTVWLRDPATNHKTLLEGQWATPEFEYLKDSPWLLTEKVDGTNIRVMWDPADGVVRFGGKTDAAMVPAPLLVALQDAFTAEKMSAAFDGPTCLYGEGYGPKIQSGGNYRDDPGFILFDVKVGDWWLRWPDVEMVAEKLGVLRVPVLATGTLHEAIEMTRAGFESTISVRPQPAEGLVMRPFADLFDRKGGRIISKVKAKDFKR